MMIIKSVENGDLPHEVLYDLVINRPELLRSHVGELVQVKWGLKEQYTLYMRLFQAYTRKFRGIIHDVDSGDNIDDYLIEVPTIPLGGELLTRCDERYLPRRCIQDAFRKMSKSMMSEVSAIILERQLKDILTFPKHKRYSVNMENVFDYPAAWQKTTSAVMQYATKRVSLELMEDSMLCPRAMDDVGNVCEETGAGVYLDDLCALCHSLPDSQEYVVMLIQKLHKYIRAVKIDYSIMENILLDLNAANEVANNLRSFRWLWSSNCSTPLPAVIFESMPKRDIRWLRELELLARGYKCCYYQTG